MGLDSRGLLGLGKDLQQVIIGEEVESGELLSLLLEVLVERFLNVLQFLVSISELLQQSLRATYIHDF